MRAIIKQSGSDGDCFTVCVEPVAVEDDLGGRAVWVTRQGPAVLASRSYAARSSTFGETHRARSGNLCGAQQAVLKLINIRSTRGTGLSGLVLGLASAGEPALAPAGSRHAAQAGNARNTRRTISTRGQRAPGNPDIIEGRKPAGPQSRVPNRTPR